MADLLKNSNKRYCLNILLLLIFVFNNGLTCRAQNLLSLAFTSPANKNAIHHDLKVCSLPFDFDQYSTVCNNNEKECNERYVSYQYPQDKDILTSYGIEETPSKFFILPKINNFQPILLGFTDSDVEGYYLKVSDNDKVISSIQVANMDGETIEDFLINEKYDIELYTRNDAGEKRVLKKKYKIQANGIIK
ncbi:hypothetical protein [Chryseobacterium sp. CT-SW4]|uniref:hypothetical protein n=1 Tax=Chryseobacterium sp. SW-1 TaxID=3157343 RepID=UPI003B016E32